MRKLHVNEATKLKLYSYIGIGKYLSICQNFFSRGIQGGAGPLNVHLGPPNISETTRARKLKLKILLDMVKYLLWVPNVSARGHLGGTGHPNVHPNVNWGPRPGL